MQVDEEKLFNEVNRLAREMATIRQLLVQVVQYIRDAESEIPEKMRRFVNAMHDVHDIKYMYEEHGQPVPVHVLRELERLDDRYRQLLAEANAPGGAFEKVRQEMASDPMNRWDHTRQLAPPTHVKEKKDETRKSESLRNGGNES